jgi:hypothetical protein
MTVSVSLVDLNYDGYYGELNDDDDDDDDDDEL